MKLEQLKNECPPMPGHLRKMIEREVHTQMTQETSEAAGERSAVRHWTFPRAAATAAIATLVIGTTAFAAKGLYQVYCEHTAAHADSLYITTEEAIPEEVPEVTVEIGYIPEGYSYDEVKEQYRNAAGDAGYMIGKDPLFMDDADPMELLSVTDSRVLRINDREAVLVNQNLSGSQDWLNTHIYVIYPEEHRILIGWAWGHADVDVLIHMLEETQVTSTERMLRACDLNRWSDYVSFINQDQFIGEEAEPKLTAAAAELQNTHEMNEAFSVMEASPISAAVTEVSFPDSVSGLPIEASLRSDLGDLIAADGTLQTDILEFYKIGDGKDDLFAEVVREEPSPVQLVSVTIAYTNTSDEIQKDVFYYATLIPAQESEGGLTFVTMTGTDFDEVQNRHLVGCGEMLWHDVNGETPVKNYISEIASGETVYVHTYYIMNEYQLQDHLYLDLTGDSLYDFTEDGRTFDVGLVKLR